MSVSRFMSSIVELIRLQHDGVLMSDSDERTAGSEYRPSDILDGALGTIDLHCALQVNECDSRTPWLFDIIGGQANLEQIPSIRKASHCGEASYL